MRHWRRCLISEFGCVRCRGSGLRCRCSGAGPAPRFASLPAPSGRKWAGRGQRATGSLMLTVLQRVRWRLRPRRLWHRLQPGLWRRHWGLQPCHLGRCWPRHCRPWCPPPHPLQRQRRCPSCRSQRWPLEPLRQQQALGPPQRWPVLPVWRLPGVGQRLERQGLRGWPVLCSPLRGVPWAFSPPPGVWLGQRKGWQRLRS